VKTSVTFNQLVYALVRRIPSGKVLNYGRVAELLGVPHGARQVGWAMSGLRWNMKDPVPWHRVVNAKGRVSIKGSPAGAAEQRALLESEGVVFDETDTLDLDKHLWNPDPSEIEDIVQEARAKLSDLDFS